MNRVKTISNRRAREIHSLKHNLTLNERRLTRSKESIKELRVRLRTVNQHNARLEKKISNKNRQSLISDKSNLKKQEKYHIKQNKTIKDKYEEKIEKKTSQIITDLQSTDHPSTFNPLTPNVDH